MRGEGDQCVSSIPRAAIGAVIAQGGGGLNSDPSFLAWITKNLQFDGKTLALTRGAVSATNNGSLKFARAVAREVLRRLGPLFGEYGPFSSQWASQKAMRPLGTPHAVYKMDDRAQAEVEAEYAAARQLQVSKTKTASMC